ncbi:MAG: phenylalanine--tRNA ligase subunit alpha [Patescibacteria group bacterium]|nr:phenylalanine--tRNA ligase subunit alpha [Patescibacteria group bacterium]
MLDLIQTLKNQALHQISACHTNDELEEVRVRYFGKKGEITKLLKKLPIINKSERKIAGQNLNEIKDLLLKEIERKKADIEKEIYQNARFDPTVPGIEPQIGNTHLITCAIDEIYEVFAKLGFSRARYPEVEYDWFAFESLNMGKGHPARDEWETFFVDAPDDKKYGEIVLTPHTSSGQVREMLRRNSTPPIRMINIAKCYRRQISIRHLVMFHQFEGLFIDKGISITHLKGTLDYFAKNFFGEKRKTRLRPFHFRFTEPSFEVDISCGVCNGTGIDKENSKCKLCKSGWLELGGAGMVHPVVLKNGGIDPNKYTGFAFGWGVERTFMMKAGLNIPDIRILYSSDLNYLKQF